MKMELTAITSALAAIGVQKKGGKGKPPGGAPPRGPRKQPPGITAGGAGAGCSRPDALGPQHARYWIKCYNCRQWGQNRRRVHEDTSRVQQAHAGSKVATVWGSERLTVKPKLNSRRVTSTTSTGKGPTTSEEQLVLEKENKCKYNNTNAIIGLLMCTAAWINVKVSPVIAASSM
jgi:hypothetical protein